MTRTCPSCGHRGPSGAFPLLPPADTPPRHDGRRRQCPACGHAGRAWTFSGRFALVVVPDALDDLLRFEQRVVPELVPPPLDQLKRAAGHPMLPGLEETA